MILQYVFFHPCAFIILLHIIRLNHFPAVGDGLKLVRYDCLYVVFLPMRTYVSLICAVLLPYKEEPHLVCHLGHALRISLLYGLQRTGYGVRASPCLYPHRALVGIVEQHLNNTL